MTSQQPNWKAVMRPGRVVILLSGKHAGNKGIIISAFPNGLKDRKYPLCLVAGISRPPKSVNKTMTPKKIVKRTSISTFVKYVNYKHLIPTRYVVSKLLDVEGLGRIYRDAAKMKKDGEKDPMENFDFRKDFNKQARALF